MQTLLALFYANDGLVVSPESARLQGAYDALTGLSGLPDQQGKYGEHGLPDMSHPPRMVNRGPPPESDGTGTLI